MRLPIIRQAMSLAIAALLAVSGSGCDRASQGTVEVLVIGEVPGIDDPAAGPLSAASALLLANAAQGLVRFDARGQVEPGLAETWNVSDDGLSYIFRLASIEWPNGRKVTADQVARLLRRNIAPASKNRLRDSLGAVEDIVAMTDRVLEIRLNAPRPELLQILAQPELALVYRTEGTGPFRIESREDGVLLARNVAAPDEVETRREQLRLTNATARSAIQAFLEGEADLVVGGNFNDLPLAQAAKLPRGALKFDPASGLFGLVPARRDGPLADAEVRALLSQAIDREALLQALAVPGLAPRTTVLERGLSDVADPAPRAWVSIPLADRRPQLAQVARRLFDDDQPKIRVHLTAGPGSRLIFERLRRDWGAIGVTVELAGKASAADLKLVDEVAPSTSPAWFLRHFRCSAAAICSEEVDSLLQGARATPIQAQRTALLLDASRKIDELHLYFPLAAPIRWSLVSDRISGFAGNRFAVHTLTGLEERLNRTQ